jgi:hypothetical protein
MRPNPYLGALRLVLGVRGVVLLLLLLLLFLELLRCFRARGLRWDVDRGVRLGLGLRLRLRRRLLSHRLRAAALRAAALRAAAACDFCDEGGEHPDKLFLRDVPVPVRIERLDQLLR